MASLERRLTEHVGFFWSPLTKVGQFNIGQSNPTYYLIDSAGRQYVLRKKPAGKLLASAHMIEREVQVIQALAKSAVPVPAIYHFCEEASVVGTPFYVRWPFINMTDG